MPSDLKERYGISKAPTLLFISPEGSHVTYKGEPRAAPCDPGPRRLVVAAMSATVLLQLPAGTLPPPLLLLLLPVRIGHLP